MEKIEIEIDTQTLELAKRLAETRQCTLSEVIAEIIKRLAEAEVTQDSWIGVFADEPELVDEIVEEALRNRVSQPLSKKIA